MELHQLLQRIDPFHRRHVFSGKKQQSGATTISGSIRPRVRSRMLAWLDQFYFPHSLRFLVESPLTGGKPLQEIGRPYVSLHDFAHNELHPLHRNCERHVVSLNAISRMSQ